MPSDDRMHGAQECDSDCRPRLKLIGFGIIAEMRHEANELFRIPAPVRLGGWILVVLYVFSCGTRIETGQVTRSLLEGQNCGVPEAVTFGELQNRTITLSAYTKILGR